MDKGPETGETDSYWGLPVNWDGHEQRVYPFFVPSVDSIQSGGWEFIGQSTNLSWVIIPERSHRGHHNV